MSERCMRCGVAFADTYERRLLDVDLDGDVHQDEAVCFSNLRAKLAEAEEFNRAMVEKAAAGSLDDYRELGARAATAENERDALRADLAALRAKEEAREASEWTWWARAAGDESPSAAEAYSNKWHAEDHVRVFGGDVVRLAVRKEEP